MEKPLVIVTGCCGRIGTSLMQRLQDKYHVVGFDLAKVIQNSQREGLISIDLSSDLSVHEAFSSVRMRFGSKIASVIHLAAYYSFDEKESPLYDAITVKGTERLLHALQDFQVEQFIFSSTMLVHAPSEHGEKIHEQSPLRGSWGYPASKIKTEELIQKMHGNIPYVILRIAGVYDDRCHSIPISHQIQRIYENQLESHFFAGNLHHGAAFVHMQDLIHAIYLSVEKRHSIPKELTLLIGEPKTLSYEHLQKTIGLLIRSKECHTISIPKWFAKIGAWFLCHLPLKKKPFIKPWMIELADDHYVLDISKAEEILNWAPQHDLSEVLPLMIVSLKNDPAQWYKENLLN